MRTTFTALALVLAAAPFAAVAQDRGGDERDDRRQVDIEPYIEVDQTVVAEFEPDDTVLTYTTVAAGVDVDVDGRNTDATASLRYERRFGYGDDPVEGDTLSGIARVSSQVVPGSVILEAGALATRDTVQSNGALVDPLLTEGDSTTQVYSAYAGPTVRGDIGEFDAEASYRFGYTRVELEDEFQPDGLIPGAPPPGLDVFDESTIHAAQASIGSAPGRALPVGVGVTASYSREDVSNLDQRVEDARVRAHVAVPLSRELAVVGGIGYENVEVSSRDAVFDPVTGDPLIDEDGRYVTDPTADREIAFETDELIWDVGVMWRPSRRTTAEAYVGRRYGSMSYFGSLSYAPSARSTFNASVFDTVTGFGGQLTNTLAGLPANFNIQRDALTGDILPCAGGSEGGTCFDGALASLRSAVFRSRGGVVSYSRTNGVTQLGIGIGYVNQEFIAAEGTVLASANGLTDQSIFATLFASTELDARSTLSGDLQARRLISGFADADNTTDLGATVSYLRDFNNSLSATAALGVDGTMSDDDALEDIWSASALIGLRYSF